MFIYVIDIAFGKGLDCVRGEYMSCGYFVYVSMDVVLCGWLDVSLVVFIID